MTLLIRDFTKNDCAGYKCVSKNSLGMADGVVRLYGKLFLSSCINNTNGHPYLRLYHRKQGEHKKIKLHVCRAQLKQLGQNIPWEGSRVDYWWWGIVLLVFLNYRRAKLKSIPSPLSASTTMLLAYMCHSGVLEKKLVRYTSTWLRTPASLIPIPVFLTSCII